MLLIVENVICGDVVSFLASEGLFELNLTRGEPNWLSASLPPQAYLKCSSQPHQSCSWAHTDSDDE